jgi:hypothetical protein
MSIDGCWFVGVASALWNRSVLIRSIVLPSIIEVGAIHELLLPLFDRLGFVCATRSGVARLDRFIFGFDRFMYGIDSPKRSFANECWI